MCNLIGKAGDLLTKYLWVAKRRNGGIFRPERFRNSVAITRPPNDHLSTLKLP
jgi:hypothetical protein